MSKPNFTYAAQPRAVRAKPKYRPPPDDDGLPENIMHDKRVVRGNTYSAHVQKAATVPAEDARVEKQQSRAWIPPTHSTIYDVKPEARRFVPVPLEQHLEEQRPPVREADAETQTAAFRARPDTPPYVPHKTGVDASTQITPEDGLFVFDKEVVPIVEVVASKTLEQSLLEVEEEEELAALRRAKRRFKREAQREQERVRAMEQAEVQRLRDKDARKQQEVARVAREAQLRSKVASLHYGAAMAHQLVHRAVDALEARGAFPDPVRAAVRSDFLPWVLDEAERRVEQHGIAHRLADELLRSATAASRRAMEAAVAKREAGKRRGGWLRVFVAAPDRAGVAPRLVGPVQVARQDTVEQVESRIREWVAIHAPDLADTYGSTLRLAYDGERLSKRATLLELNIPNDGKLELLGAQDGSEEEGEADGEQAEGSHAE